VPTAAPGEWLQVALAKGLIDPAQLLPRSRPAELPAASATRAFVPPPPPDCPEKEFQAAVMRLAEANGWKAFHVHDSRRSNPGFPDVVAVRAGVLLFAELKKQRGGRLNEEQRAWLAELEAVPGVRVFRWRPVEWPQIVAALQAG
jgi:hypothetical protein